MRRSRAQVIVVAVMVVMFSAVGADAHKQGSPDYWSRQIASNDLKDLAAIMADPSRARWPALTWGGSDTTADKRRRRLAKELFEKIRAAAQNHSMSNETVASKVKTYAALIAAMRAGGGYLNFVLLDTAYRLASFEVCSYLIGHPEEFQFTSDLLGQLNPSVLTLNEAIILAAEEVPAETLKNLPKSEDLESYNKLFASLQTSLTSAFAGPALDMTTSRLLNGLNVSKLLARLLETNKLISFNLPGTIEFLRRGGKFGDIHLDDVTQFRERMGNERTRFKFTQLGVHLLSASDIKAIIDDCAGATVPHFIMLAVE